jgi:plasmid stabilization system protein ParE
MGLTGFLKNGSPLAQVDGYTIREKFVFRYRIIYRVRQNAIEVMTVRHSSQELDLSDFDKNS